MYPDTHTHVESHARVHTCTHAHTRMHARTHARTHTHTGLKGRMHVHICMHMNTQAHTIPNPVVAPRAVRDPLVLSLHTPTHDILPSAPYRQWRVLGSWPGLAAVER